MFDVLRKTNPICSPTWTFAGKSFGELMFWLPPRARVVVEGLEHLPRGPAIICPNHTHKFDAIPIRCTFLDHGMQLMTWIKARDYKHPALRWVLGNGGNIPLVSRGFLIAADFAQVSGRKPTEDEYRQLRAHIDGGEGEVPLAPALLTQLSSPRRISGVDVSFARGYRHALRDAYHTLMQESLRHARHGRDQGRHQHIYPQGATSKQLTPGHPGAVQAALALDLPILPIGLSGCREVYVGKDHPLTRAGKVTLRIGAPITVPKSIVPPSFRPFHPDDEDAFRSPLQAQTDIVMNAINELCDAEYRWADDLRSDAKQGVGRFYV